MLPSPITTSWPLQSPVCRTLTMPIVGLPQGHRSCLGSCGATGGEKPELGREFRCPQPLRVPSFPTSPARTLLSQCRGPWFNLWSGNSLRRRGAPITTLQCDNSIRGFTELMESLYSWLWFIIGKEHRFIPDKGRSTRGRRF